MKIDDGIPIADSRGRNAKYPWDELGVGQSFYVEGVSQKAMQMTGKYHAAKLGRTFKAAKYDAGVRVWRIQ